MEDMSLDKNDENSKLKMMEILKRMHESNGICTEGDMSSEVDSDDEDNYADIADRLAGVDLDNADEVWDKLNDDERQEFVAFLQTGDVSKLIPKWEPWWSYHDSRKVKEVEEKKEYVEKCPKIREDILDFITLSVCMIFSILLNS